MRSPSGYVHILRDKSCVTDKYALTRVTIRNISGPFTWSSALLQSSISCIAVQTWSTFSSSKPTPGMTKRCPISRKGWRVTSWIKRPVGTRRRAVDVANVDSQPEHFFERHSWEMAKSTEFRELNFAFQSLLQGYG
jgi:hypothetical protein